MENVLVPVKATSLVDGIVNQLEEGIISGRLAPGAKLSEQGLARMLGVSRGPLREAMRRLEGRKLIVRVPNIGARVAQLSGKDLIELLEIREALEGMAARSAAQNMSDSDIQTLDKLVERHGKQPEVRDGVGYYQETPDFDFHFHIIKGSKNERLIEMLCGELYDLLRVYRYKSSTLHGRARAAFNEHRVIVDALKTRDPERTEQAMRFHLSNARRQVEQWLLENEGLHIPRDN
ncbi:MAG TPA: GntR family transcriptional regulator [Devosia sp.]|nr:GntR family transcriptional regulator [Devosia sp.]